MNRELKSLDAVLRAVRRNRPVWVATSAVGEIPIKYVDALARCGLIRACTNGEVAAHAEAVGSVSKPVTAKEGEK